MVLMAMANSWDTLTLQTARYDDIVRAEANSAHCLRDTG